MKILIIGGSGFIGSKLSKELLRQGHSVVCVDTNSPTISGVAFVPSPGDNTIPKNTMLAHTDVVINLAGRSILGPWNQEHKDSMYTSRVKTTESVVDLFKDSAYRPKVFIQASATGVYGNRNEETLSEGSETRKNTFLAELAYEWEKRGSQAKKYGIRTVIVRQGNVLGSAGLLATLVPFYKKGLGGPVGKGDNWFPWIHVDDLVSLYIHIIEDASFQGIVNAVSGEVVRYKEFSRSLAKVLQKPHFLRIPKFLFRLQYKGFTDEITSSQKVGSLRIWELGESIRFKKLQDALSNILH